MKDMQAQLEKLREDAADCALIRDLATDPKKRELEVFPVKGPDEKQQAFQQIVQS